MRTRLMLMLAVLTPMTARSQATDTTAIPRELVSALMGGAPRITVGAAPPGFPRELLPASGRVLGGAIYRYGGGSRLTTIVRVDAGSEAALDVIGAEFARMGWTKPVYPSSQRGGFAVAFPGDRMPNLWCGDSGMVDIGASGRRGESAIVSVSFIPSVENTLCDPQFYERARGMPERIELPTLRLPDGVNVVSGGGGGGGDYQESLATAFTEMGAVALIDSLVEQLRADGWTLVTKLGDGDAAIGSARKKNDRGQDTFARVVASRSSPDRLDLSIRVTVPEADRRTRSFRTTRIPEP